VDATGGILRTDGALNYNYGTEMLMLMRCLLRSQHWQSTIVQAMQSSLNELNFKKKTWNVEDECMYRAYASLCIMGGHTDSIRIGGRSVYFHALFRNIIVYTCVDTILINDRIETELYDGEVEKGIVIDCDLYDPTHPLVVLIESTDNNDRETVTFEHEKNKIIPIPEVTLQFLTLRLTVVTEVVKDTFF
jgi:hypothetical protein